MMPGDKIQKAIQDLPASHQAEVLDFVEYLKAKADRAASIEECRDWSHFSLYSAMREIEHEDAPIYTLADVKVSFS